MLKFEKQLKTIIRYYQARPYGSIDREAVGLSIADAGALHGLGLIDRVRQDMAGHYSFYLTPKGLSYFTERRIEVRAFWREFFSKFFAGVLVGVVSTLLVTFLTGSLRF